MTKPRDICSIRAGLHRALGLLDEELVAKATGKSASLFRKCADPDNPRHRLQAEDALALDAACIAAGERPQVLDAYRQALDARVAAQGGVRPHRAADPCQRIAEIMRELGLVADIVANTVADRHVTPENAQRCGSQIDRTLDALARLKLDLRGMTATAAVARLSVAGD
ncbi:MAG: hypothetical protein HY059_23970 [Proteobacteria bacterium]|nr:hypothetical protein [Pseudomonadota bacterium]